jgi:hypothetical protein
MISERTFARSFASFWLELLPLLTPNFVHIVNYALANQLVDEHDVLIDPVKKKPAVRDPSVVAEFAFFIAQLSVSEGVGISNIRNNDNHIERAQKYAYEIVKRYEGGESRILLPLNQEEIEEGLAIAMNYERFFEIKCKNKIIEFGPIISGAGFVSECKADISIGNTLFEVKTFDRNLASKDIRQLIIYLALQGITGNRRWDYAGFFNPRRALYYEFRVDEVIRELSGGKSSLDVFQEISDFITRRDIQIDSVF